MSNITLNFFGDSITVPKPKNLQSLRKIISLKFYLKPKDAEEIVLTYTNKGQIHTITTEEELQEVLHVAMADFVNELPEGIDTTLGERGIGLSEGQAQRIAIARGLLRPGNILLLDEISASLDEETEQELFRRLFDYCKNKTMVFITHRPAVSALCNNVIKLQ
jgi:ABC-type transport system involved in cytochrome bd biosynthesis fused ATPase/permease subunit